ncbi:hypothetical protein DERF_014203 [Dermatophagoides farinae]|uniref:Uncharacterized protein n=1 Tax=Dermatophagoides farinae TaxID=6954 RepID=A0A922HH22_DERFA|nr:hypothetical protein DERF_014203 [Dermatophagoides farinae]
MITTVDLLPQNIIVLHRLTNVQTTKRYLIQSEQYDNDDDDNESRYTNIHCLWLNNSSNLLLCNVCKDVEKISLEQKKLFFLTFGWIMFAFSHSQIQHMSPEK